MTYGDPRQLKGATSEAIALQILIKHGYHVFIPFRKNGPVDLYCIHPDTGRELKLDIKTDGTRMNPGRSKAARIHRRRSPTQKKLGVYMGYCNIQNQRLWITFGRGEQPLVLE